MTPATAQVGRNAPCPCGSGRKFKQCCLGKTEELQPRSMVVPGIVAGLGGVAGIVVGMGKGVAGGLAVAVFGLLIAGGIALFRNLPPPGSGGNSPGAINFGG